MNSIDIQFFFFVGSYYPTFLYLAILTGLYQPFQFPIPG